MRPHLSAAFALAALLLGGCATTPQSRIEKNPSAFAALTPEQQERVKTGGVGVGFDEAAVRFALGEPDRVIERETAEGMTQSWVYYSLVSGFDNSGYCAPRFPYYGAAFYCEPSRPNQYEERTRVVFKDGKVVSVDRAKK